jgi:hypothetical protein
MDHSSYDLYINEIVLKCGHDAMGLLILIVPIILKINLNIVHIDTTTKARNNENMQKFSVTKNPST